MFVVDYLGPAHGWGIPRIEPYHRLTIATAATSLHYGIEGFIGFTILQNKVTGEPQGFRVLDNLNSFRETSQHLDLPSDFDVKELQKCIGKLIHLEKDWFPKVQNPDRELP